MLLAALPLVVPTVVVPVVIAVVLAAVIAVVLVVLLLVAMAVVPAMPATLAMAVVTAPLVGTMTGGPHMIAATGMIAALFAAVPCLRIRRVLLVLLVGAREDGHADGAQAQNGGEREDA